MPVSVRFIVAVIIRIQCVYHCSLFIRIWNLRATTMNHAAGSSIIYSLMSISDDGSLPQRYGASSWLGRFARLFRLMTVGSFATKASNHSRRYSKRIA